jgi:hypothetical protein
MLRRQAREEEEKKKKKRKKQSVGQEQHDVVELDLVSMPVAPGFVQLNQGPSKRQGKERKEPEDESEMRMRSLGRVPKFKEGDRVDEVLGVR